MNKHTTHALSVDDGRVTEYHVTSALLIQFGDSSPNSLQSKGGTVGEPSDGALCQILDDVGDWVGLLSEELVDFLKDTDCQRRRTVRQLDVLLGGSSDIITLEVQETTKSLKSGTGEVLGVFTLGLGASGLDGCSLL